MCIVYKRWHGYRGNDDNVDNSVILYVLTMITKL